MTSTAHHSETAPEPVGNYPHARKVGDMLFLSGVGPRQKGSKEIPGVTLDAAGNITDYDIEAQQNEKQSELILSLRFKPQSEHPYLNVSVERII